MSWIVVTAILDGVSEERGIITFVCLRFLFRECVLLRRLMFGIPYAVFSPQIPRHERSQQHSQTTQREENAVASMVMRSIAGLEDEPRDCATHVTLVHRQ